ncbi:MAG: hypothetical protein WC942_11675 [Clostridia bacterium]|jgi:hypothetical protein
MKDREYKNNIELISIIAVRGNAVINAKKTFVAFTSHRALERFRVKFEDRFNKMFKSQVKIDIHYREI